LLRIRFRRNVFTESLVSNELIGISGVMSQYNCTLIQCRSSNTWPPVLPIIKLILQIQHLISTPYCLGHSKESVQVWDPV
jgi:hypothetical protein